MARLYLLNQRLISLNKRYKKMDPDSPEAAKLLIEILDLGFERHQIREDRIQRRHKVMRELAESLLEKHREKEG